MGDASKKCLHLLQGGGVYVSYGEATFTACAIFENTAYYVHAYVALPSRVMGDASRKCLFILQGGGVYVYNGGDATFTSCNIFENTADFVSAHAYFLIGVMGNLSEKCPHTDLPCMCACMCLTMALAVWICEHQSALPIRVMGNLSEKCPSVYVRLHVSDYCTCRMEM